MIKRLLTPRPSSRTTVFLIEKTGDKMKNFLAPFLLIILISNAANAEGKPRAWEGSGNCYRDTYYQYGFICGTSIEDDTKCGGKKAKKLKQKYFFNEGECFGIDHADNATGENISYFCCCSGTWKSVSNTKDNSQKFGGWSSPGDYNGNVWYTKTSTTIDVSGGTCTYEKQVNMCGTEISTPCKTPTSCTNGLVKRNGVCTTPCPEGQAWESGTSNKCIECETTNHQGIGIPDNWKECFTNQDPSKELIKDKLKYPTCELLQQGKDNNICHKCNPDTQFFKTELDTSKTVGKCIAKSSLKETSKEIMAKCAFCATNTIVKNCMNCFRGADSVAAKDQCVTTYATDCLISE